MNRAIKAVFHRTGIVGRLRGIWQREFDRSAREIRRETDTVVKALDRTSKGAHKSQTATDSKMSGIEKRLARLETATRAADESMRTAVDTRMRAIEKRLARFELAARVDAEQDRVLSALASHFDPAGVCAHAAHAVATAPLREDPCAHLVIDNIFPRDFYDLLVSSLPAVDFFPPRDPVKMNLAPSEFGIVPRLTRVLWQFVEADLAQTIADAALDRLRPFILARYEMLFGRDRSDAVLAMPHHPSGGRLMLRRPGYCLRPHLDPKRSSLTALLYIARPGDPETVGTELYELAEVVNPMRTATYYPEDQGVACTLKARVPFKANTALIFVNANAAHAASIPTDTHPTDLLRYAFQFYVGPDIPRLLEFVSGLSPAEQQPWLGLARFKGDRTTG